MQQLTDQNEHHVETTEEKYYTHLKVQKKYYSDRSKRYKRSYQSLLLFGTIGAIIVPILIVTPDVSKFWPTILSALVSIAIAIENVFHFGDNWRTFRQTLEGLRQEQVLYDNHVGPYVDVSDAFKQFVERTMTIMNRETTIYFEINKQKNEDSKANKAAIGT
jgi:hypothetical protein